MKYTVFGFIILAAISSACRNSYNDLTSIIDLSGSWAFQLDSANTGITDKWFNTDLNDSIRLPGTTDENKKGIYLDEKAVDRLSRVWYWKGAAWYQKEVEIPENTGSQYWLTMQNCLR